MLRNRLPCGVTGLLIWLATGILDAQDVTPYFSSYAQPSTSVFTADSPPFDGLGERESEIERLTQELAAAESEIARLLAGNGASAESGGGSSARESAAESALAEKSQNPISDLVSLPLQNNFDFGLQPGNRTRYIGNLQPVIPVKLNDQWNLISRFIIPFVNLPTGPETRADGIGDTFGQFFFSPRDSGVLTWGIGPSALFPTSSERRLGVGEWGAGVNGVALVTKDRIVAGFLANQIWTMQGSSKPFPFQPFFNYNFDRGWFFAASGEFAADWEQPDPTRWISPAGAGIGRVFPIFGQTVNIATRFAPFLDGPPGGPDWQFRLNVTLLFPK